MNQRQGRSGKDAAKLQGLQQSSGKERDRVGQENVAKGGWGMSDFSLEHPQCPAASLEQRCVEWQRIARNTPGAQGKVSAM